MSQDCVIGMCIHSRRTGVKCEAEIRFRPKKFGLIVPKPKKNEKEQNRFHINFEVDPDADDWEIEPGSGVNEHLPFCLHQVPRNKRTYDEAKLEDPDFQVRKTEKMKYCRNNKYSPMQRAYRAEHTAMAIVSGRYEMGTVQTAWNMIENHGLRFPAKMSDLDLERQSSLYHQTKNQTLIDGLDENLLYLMDTDKNDLAVRVPLIRPEEETEKFGRLYHTVVPYSQIYIITNSFEYLNSTFNMPPEK